ncbi:Calmodulin-dependent protein kinase cmk2 [Dimargaris xerosporica]|nr:Calmodulin-dependent protein kinase cmk2 [Dimargaris xerosporica]
MVAKTPNIMGLLDHLHLGQPQPPSHVKKKDYRFGRMLGSGTFGEVYECVRKSDKTSVAIKVIRKALLNGDHTLVEKEMDVMRDLHHPNIVEFLDYFESRERYYLVFSLATGGELFERITQRGRFSEQDAVREIRTVFQAVEYLHEHNVVHRDLKPENLLYRDKSADSPLVIADFGIAKTMADEDDVLTTVCGSYGYVAPEIMRRRGYGKPVDIWSLGVITFTLLCGYSPYYYCETPQHMLLAMERHEVVFEKRYWWGVSEGAKDFIRALLHPDPAKRPTAAEALRMPWLSGTTALDNDLLPDVIEQSKARSTFQRAVRKIQVFNRLRNLSISSSDNDEESQSSNGGAARRTSSSSETGKNATTAPKDATKQLSAEMAPVPTRSSNVSELSSDSFVSAKEQ